MAVYPSGAGTARLSALQAVYFLACAGALLAASRIAKSKKLSWFPEASAIMVVGALAAGCMAVIDSSFRVTFSPSLFFQLLLPPLIFKSGFDIDLKLFHKNFTAIMVYANLGTLINIAVVCGLMAAAANFGLCTPVSVAEALAFGAVISATDPVTTIAVFERLHVDQTLYVIVVGVSVLDDAISVLVFDLCSHFVTSGQPLHVSQLLWPSVLFLCKLFGSMILGALVAVACLAVMFRWNTQILHEKNLLIIVFVSLVYVSFSLAEALFLSGIISAMFTALACQHYMSLLSRRTLQELRDKLTAWASFFETLVFLYMGWTLFNHVPHGFLDWSFVFLSIVACFVGRVLQVYPLAWLLNRSVGTSSQTTSSSPPSPLHEPAMSLPHQHMLLLAGLRGPIAFATALWFPQGSPHDHRPLVAATSALTVFLTSTVLGAATIPSLRYFGIQHTDSLTEPVEAPVAEMDTAIVNALEDSAWMRAIDERCLQWFRSQSQVSIASPVAMRSVESEGNGTVRSIIHSTLWSKKNGWISVPHDDTPGTPAQRGDGMDDVEMKAFGLEEEEKPTAKR